jgi:hypothetical protein
MIGDGVIAESIVSFKITWKNPGNGEQPIWNQNDQLITFHSTSIYPDLLYTKAQGIATYYRYTTIDSIVRLLKQINAVIDSKLIGGAKTNEAATETDSSEPASPEIKDEVTSDSPKVNEPAEPDTSPAYTVTVYGDKLQLIDGQTTNANIRIRHKISDNLFRKIEDAVIDNSKKIWLEVTGIGARSVRIELLDFKTADGLNLLVQVLPTVDLLLQAGEKTITPKSERDEDYMDRIKHLRNLRMTKEEDRFTRSKQEINKSIQKTRSINK